MFRSKSKDLMELAGFRKRRWYKRKPRFYTHKFIPEVSQDHIGSTDRHQLHLLRNGTFLVVWRIFPYTEGLPTK